MSGERSRGGSRGRAALTLVVVVALAASLAIVPSAVRPGADADTAWAQEGGERVPEDVWRARTDDYLAWATSLGLSQGSVPSILAHAERHDRDPSFAWDANAPDPSDFEGRFQQLREFRDTGDFAINDYLFTLLRHGDQLRPDLRAAFEERILNFKYWWDEPTPDGITDSQYYWTENHLIIFLANEYIAGQTYPDTVFANNGMTGRERMEHARPLLLRWMSLRARFGFSEWLSHVYWMEDLKGLLLLADWADDEEIAHWASAVLDTTFVELASHLQNGAFGSTHGRTYLKDKMTSRDEDTYAMAKMVFDDTPFGYENVDNASLLATARRYRPPEVARQIAKSATVDVVQQRQSLPIDPLAPIVPDPQPAYDLPYDDPLVWWAMGAQFPWQVVPLSIDLINSLNLLETDLFQDLGVLKPIIESTPLPQLQELAASLAPAVNAGLLSEVNTYTWRSPEVMLSTAQDWRKGQRSEQVQTNQVTFDPDALVFTNHPGKDAPVTEQEARSNSSYYWTGQATSPRSVQHERVNVSMYAPQYESDPSNPIPFLQYEDLTHAFFPTEHFDQVVEQDGWVIGRKGDGYVALWSWRPTTWRTYAPGTYTLGLTERYDLVAEGGADNVWITEVGRRVDWASAPDPFAAFVAAVTASDPQVTPRPAADGSAHTARDGFDVAYASPAQGPMSVGWDGAFLVDGTEQPLADYPRWDSPFTHVDFDTWRYRVSAGGATLDHDFTVLAALTGADVPETTTTSTSTTTSIAPGDDDPDAAVDANAVTDTYLSARPRFTG
jgi:hypothetical protein